MTTLEELFRHFEYASWKRLEGIGIFEPSNGVATFYYSYRETLFSDGEIITDNPAIGERTYKNPTYCISMVCVDPNLASFEVFLADTSKETIDKASAKLRELVNEVYRGRSKLKHSLSHY